MVRLTPALTNEKCSFWHFSFDGNTSMKMEALTTYLAKEKTISKVYLINQKTAHGQQVSRYAKELLAHKRPDLVIVGDDLHQIGQVKDFTLRCQDQILWRRHRYHRQLGQRPCTADQVREGCGNQGKFLYLLW